MPRSLVWKPVLLLGLALVALVAGCQDPVRIRLVVAPEMVEIQRGESVTVTATYERNDVPEPVGAEARWSSALPSIASVTAGPDGTAVITGVSNGATEVVVRALGLQNSLLVKVVSPDFTSLSVTPPSSNVAAGLQTQLTATARLENGQAQVVTGQVTWTSSDEIVASVDAAGEVTTHRTGTTIVTATLGQLSAFATVTVTSARITQIVVSPSGPQVPIGGTRQLTAMGTFTDGSMRDVTFMVAWSSSQPAVASVSQAALVTGAEIGQTTISAQQSTVVGSTLVTVVPAQLESITVTPANPSVAAGLPRQFTATGRNTDGSTADLTTTVTWSSTMMAVATISNVAGSQGRATTLVAGATTIRATLGAISGETGLTVTAPVLASIRVTPAAPMVPLGRGQQFMATGVLTDSSTTDLTQSVTWDSTAPGVATISNAAGSRGLAQSVNFGATTISATSGAISGIATMVVGPAALESLRVEPANSSLAIGASRQMHAIGSYSDGTMPDISGQVTWSSSVPAHATITAAGLAHAVAVGPTTIGAQLGAVNASTTLTVTPVELASITVTPASPSVVAGASQQFTATGRYTDDSVMDVTTTAIWSSSAPTVATVSNDPGTQGLARTLAGGAATISATVGTVSGAALLTSQAVTVSAFSPAESTTGVRAFTPVSVTFSQAMDPSSLFGQLQAGPCGGSLQLSRDDFATCVAFTTNAPVMSVNDTVATLTPAQPLRALQAYKLRVLASAASAAGAPMVATVTQAAPFSIATDGECAAEVVISQVYGGGGSPGATIKHDFIELHNPGPTPVALAGKAVQLVTAAGTGPWTVQALPDVSIPPGGYFLIQEAAGAGAQPPLANPDFQPATPFAMDATAGKVALTATTTPLVGDCPLAATLDLVGYGATATCFEGAGPLDAPGDTTGLSRNAGGCTDRNLASDFTLGPPAPRNGLTAPSVCVCWVNETDLEAEIDYCNLQFPTVVSGPAPLAIGAIYGRVYEAGFTEPAGPSPKVRMALGFGAADSDPRGWTWVDAAFNVSVGNNDEYQAPLTFPVAGAYDFTSRATRDGTSWTLCDQDGAGSNAALRFNQFQTGSANVQ